MTAWTYLRTAGLLALLIALSLVASSMAAKRAAKKTNLVGKDLWFNIDAKNIWLDTGLASRKEI